MAGLLDAQPILAVLLDWGLRRSEVATQPNSPSARSEDTPTLLFGLHPHAFACSTLDRSFGHRRLVWLERTVDRSIPVTMGSARFAPFLAVLDWSQPHPCRDEHRT